MWKKARYLIIPVLVPGILVAVLLVYGSREPPAWHQIYEQYAVYLRFLSPHPQTLTLISAEKASRPWYFFHEQAENVFGTNGYYEVDMPQNKGSMPLNYPPQEVWCLLVEVRQQASSSSECRLLFAVEHSDLYNATWVIHVPLQDLSDYGLHQEMERIGCEVPIIPPASLASRDGLISPPH
jgi:GAF domain-containing protein